MIFNYFEILLFLQPIVCTPIEGILKLCEVTACSVRRIVFIMGIAPLFLEKATICT